jgi:hypothetical protein
MVQDVDINELALKKREASIDELRKAYISNSSRVGAGIIHHSINFLIQIEDLALDIARCQNNPEKLDRLMVETERAKLTRYLEFIYFGP